MYERGGPEESVLLLCLQILFLDNRLTTIISRLSNVGLASVCRTVSVPGCIPTLPLKQRTHYLNEVPRQARVTHLVRCISRSPLRMRKSFLGFTVEELVSPLSLACPVGLPFDLCAHGCALSCQLPLTLHIGRAFRKGTQKTVSESVRRVYYTRHILPMGVFSLYAARSGRYRLCVGELYRVRRAITGTRPTSTIFPSPDATGRHPFFGPGLVLQGLAAFTAASAGVSGVSPALSAFSFRPTPRYLAFDILPARRHAPLSLMSPPSRSTSRRLSPQHLGVCGRSLCGHRDLYGKCSTATSVGVGPELAHRRKLLIGSLIGPLPHPWHRVAHIASVLAYIYSVTLRDSCFRRLIVDGCAMRTYCTRSTGASNYLTPHGWPMAIYLACAGLLPIWDYTRAKKMLRAVPIDIYVGRDITQVDESRSCPLGKCSSPRVSVGCAAPSVSENTGDSSREYLAFCVVYDWAFVSGVFSNSPLLCVFGAITTIGLGEGTKLENGNLESVRLVDRFGHQGTRSSKRRFMYTFPLPVRIARGDFPSAPRYNRYFDFCSGQNRYDIVSQWENFSPVGISGSVGPRAVIVDYTRYPHFGFTLSRNAGPWPSVACWRSTLIGLPAIFGMSLRARVFHGARRARSARDIRGVGRRLAARSARDIHGVRLALIDMLDIELYMVFTVTCADTRFHYASGLAAISTWGCFVSLVEGARRQVWQIPRFAGLCPFRAVSQHIPSVRAISIFKLWQGSCVIVIVEEVPVLRDESGEATLTSSVCHARGVTVAVDVNQSSQGQRCGSVKKAGSQPKPALQKPDRAGPRRGPEGPKAQASNLGRPLARPVAQASVFGAVSWQAQPLATSSELRVPWTAISRPTSLPLLARPSSPTPPALPLPIVATIQVDINEALLKQTKKHLSLATERPYQCPQYRRERKLELWIWLVQGSPGLPASCLAPRLARRYGTTLGLRKKKSTWPFMDTGQLILTMMLHSSARQAEEEAWICLPSRSHAVAIVIAMAIANFVDRPADLGLLVHRLATPSLRQRLRQPSHRPAPPTLSPRLRLSSPPAIPTFCLTPLRGILSASNTHGLGSVHRAPQPSTYRRLVFANWSMVLAGVAIIPANISTLFSTKAMSPPLPCHSACGSHLHPSPYASSPSPPPRRAKAQSRCHAIATRKTHHTYLRRDTTQTRRTGPIADDNDEATSTRRRRRPQGYSSKDDIDNAAADDTDTLADTDTDTDGRKDDSSKDDSVDIDNR
ncbi:hypothetical protein EDB84DRAFT_1440441 [Lactarius hengduanensis]|nr:hypothetical protein EDB84DRAFT_1440441 [Lactarius hengduanensis]